MLIRNKPRKPIRINSVKQTKIYDGCTLQSLLNQIPQNVDLSKCIICFNRDYYDDRFDVELTYEFVESDDSLQIRNVDYKIELAEYNKWYEVNKETIECQLEANKLKELAIKQAQKDKEYRDGLKQYLKLKVKFENADRK